MAVLCAQSLATGIERDYVLSVIRARGLPPDPYTVEVEEWPWPVKVFMLGHFEVWRDGKPIPFSRKEQKRPLTLLKGLIALGGDNVSEERLSDLLWPDADGDAAQRALATTVHRLRQLLTHDLIHRHGGRLSLDRRHCWVDVWALERKLERAEHSLGTRNPGRQAWIESAEWTEQALRLYRGHCLADDSSVPWAVSFAERLRDRLLLQVQKVAQHWAQSGNWAKAAECYRRGVSLHACSEQCCRGLMTAYLHLGLNDAALTAYERCARSLQEQAGIRLSPQTKALLDGLKSAHR
jgi:LuxR family transcriptional regulator, maltose regulon positive regulatory protein